MQPIQYVQSFLLRFLAYLLISISLHLKQTISTFMFVHLSNIQRLHPFLFGSELVRRGDNILVVELFFPVKVIAMFMNFCKIGSVLLIISLVFMEKFNPIVSSNHVGWRKIGTFFWSSCQLVQFICHKHVVKRHLCLLFCCLFPFSLFFFFLVAFCKLQSRILSAKLCFVESMKPHIDQEKCGVTIKIMPWKVGQKMLLPKWQR